MSNEFAHTPSQGHHFRTSLRTTSEADPITARTQSMQPISQKFRTRTLFIDEPVEDERSMASKSVNRLLKHTTKRRGLFLGLGAAASAGIAASVASPCNARAKIGCLSPNAEVVYNQILAFETLDAEEIILWLDDDVLYENTGLPDISGKSAVQQFIPQFANLFESLVIDILNIKSFGSLVCTERVENYTVAQDAPIGYPGAELALRVASWYQVEQGLITRWSDYWDNRIFTTTLGVPLPTP